MSKRIITGDMPEPESGHARELYLVLDGGNPHDETRSFPVMLVHESGDSGHAWGTAEDDWFTWQSIILMYSGCTIESLTDHDREIARKAWEQGANDWSWYQTRIPDEPVPDNPYESEEPNES